MHLSPSNVLASHLAPEKQKKNKVCLHYRTFQYDYNAHTAVVLPFRLLLRLLYITDKRLERSSLTTSQQVLDQLLVATETSIIPEGQERSHFKLMG